MNPPLPAKGSLLDLEQAGALVYQITLMAAACGCIPIAAAVLRPEGHDSLYKLEGCGHNELGWGVPFVHGETGAFRDAGLIDYRDCLLLSSLSPCEFCQGCAAHLGIKEVRYLDALSFIPDQSSFDKFGIVHQELRHQQCCEHFSKWLLSDSAPDSRNLWHQDIGGYSPDPALEIDLDRLAPAMRQVLELMRYSAAFGEYPCAAAVVDGQSFDILSFGPGAILRTNDPTAVPEIFAGRRCGARTRWDRVIFVTSSSPSPIALGMYRRWGVSNVVVLDPEPIAATANPEGFDRIRLTYAPAQFSEPAATIIGNWLRETPQAHSRYLQKIYWGKPITPS